MIKIDKLVRSKRKTMSFQVSKEGELIVRVPEKVSKKSIEDMLRKHAEWIIDKQEKAKVKLNYQKQYQEGENFYYLGKPYPLRLKSDYEYAFEFSEEEFILDASLQDEAKDLFIQWYKIQAKRIFPKKVAEIAEAMRLKYNKVKVSSATKRWGSCSTSGNINLSYKLVILPTPIIDYVIIHELCHLVHFSHSKDFWALVKRCCPEYKKIVKWMDENADKMTV